MRREGREPRATRSRPRARTGSVRKGHQGGGHSGQAGVGEIEQAGSERGTERDHAEKKGEQSIAIVQRRLRAGGGAIKCLPSPLLPRVGVRNDSDNSSSNSSSSSSSKRNSNITAQQEQ